LKIVSNTHSDSAFRKGWFGLPKSSFGEHNPRKGTLKRFYAFITHKRRRCNADFIFEGREYSIWATRTKDEMRIFDWVFNGSKPKSSTHDLEKCFLRNPHFIFCSSFQNLRLGGVNLQDDSMRVLAWWCACRTRKMIAWRRKTYVACNDSIVMCL